MDEELLRRFRDGDLTAGRAVRNHLRAVAARVLAAPQWRLDDPHEVSRLEVLAATEALGLETDDVVSYAVGAMAAASKQGVGFLRTKERVPTAQHPEPGLLVAVALETASAAQAAHLEAHLEECAICTRHMQVIRHALRAAATVNNAMAPPKLVARAPEAPPPEAKPARPAAKRPAARGAKGPTAAKARGKRPKPRPRKGKKPESKGGLVPLVLVAVLAVGGFWYQSRWTDEQKSWAVLELLPGELPPSARAALYDGTAKEALADLSAGRCKVASSRLGAAAKSAGGDAWLSYYQGLALVCARDPRAAAVLDAVRQDASPAPFGLDWWQAQAFVISGEHDRALTLLDGLASSSHPRASQASTLASELRQLLTRF